MVVLDYGHGIDTPGKRCGDFYEWEFTRAVGLFLEAELDKRKIEYHILVPERDDIGLRTRVERAKAVNHELLVSIHGNAFKDPSVSGIETWYYSQKGKIAAEILQRHLIHRLRWTDRGTKKGNFYILKKTPRPAILSESGFYTNEKDRTLMTDPFWQWQIAIAHADAIKEYYESIY